MSEIKFPNTSYKPKQLLHRMAEEEELAGVLVIGMRTDGSLRWESSTTAPHFLSIASTTAQTLAMHYLGLTIGPAAPPPGQKPN